MKNKILFNLINALLLTLLASSLVEAFTYSGFLIKHFGLGIGLALLSIFALSFYLFRKIYKNSIIMKMLVMATYLMTILYLIFSTLEKINYSNYVFSHFHLHPYLFLLSTILMSLLFLINDKTTKVNIYIYVVLFIVSLQYLINGATEISRSHIGFMFKNINANYNEKMEVLVEKIPYDFAMFIKNNTPENSTILIPPQSYPWDKTSNVGYLRYFLYPRNLINGGEKNSAVDLSTIDFVLIDYGETNISENGFTNVWPKFDVKGNSILYWNPETGETIEDKTGIYKYNENDRSEKWGIIRIKH